MPSNEDSETEFVDMTSTFIRRMIMDASACEHAPELCKLMGLVPPSSEVEEEEHRASHLRYERTLPLLPFAIVATSHMAHLQVALAVQGETSPDTPDAKQVLHEHYMNAIGSSVIAILSQMLDQNFITYGSGRT